jgi:hypothetical protein
MICYKHHIKWTHYTMHTLIMFLYFTLPKKYFFTNTTAICTIVYSLTSVHTLMFLQVTLITVRFVIHTAREQTLSSIQLFMFLQITLMIE